MAVFFVVATSNVADSLPMINTLYRATKQPALKRTFRNRAVAGIVAALVLMAGSSNAQPIARPFPFTLPASDTLQSTSIGGLAPEAGPAGKHGAFHLSPEGHFVATDGARIKFFGTEIQWTANFIDGQHAEIF